ncbi:MAG: TatD family hydrolase [Betaproteobacteria bacterium]|nr:TatD family hydrolase [Betaproteobacteria bacterium]
MFVDSHCHLDFPEFEGTMDAVRAEMSANGVTHALCVSVSMQEFPKVAALAGAYPNFCASAGVHPDHDAQDLVTEAELLRAAAHPKVVAIGETGLDYYRQSGDLEWQRSRFRLHIRAARQCGKPLIIHTREATADTLRIMREECADQAGGVMHCFTGTREVAEAAMAMGFYISFSGIVTFRKATDLKELARLLPLDRLLIETDSPYLAPAPYRGKTNRPGLVKFVAEEIAKLKGLPVAEVAAATSDNFFRLFKAKR